MGDTTEGTTDFWEAGINAISRPMDRLRIGAQLFARDLGNYDNGQPQLDWAYADWRAADTLGYQVGRFKLPIGLYNEVLDVDAARTPIFLPSSVYALRSRDLYISTDGSKAYGLIDPDNAGNLEYQVYAGHKDFDTDRGFARYLTELGLGDQINSINVDLMVGTMVHWNCPVPRLGVRFAIVDAHKFEVVKTNSTTGVTTTASTDHYISGIASVAYETEGWTFAAIFNRFYSRGTINLSIPGVPGPINEGLELVSRQRGALLILEAAKPDPRWILVPLGNAGPDTAPGPAP